MSSVRRTFAFALILLACGATLAQDAGRKSSGSPKRLKPNILLVTIDTLRADRLGCYGARNVDTPTIDALAREGTVFDRAISQVPLTWPSHVSMLTGTYPFHNGVQDFTGQPLSSKFRSVAQALKANGYHTGAVISSFVLDRSWGLARGFDSYDDAFAGSDFLTKDLALVERRAGASVDRAITWLSKPGTRPFFLWLHLFDPHSPYDAPAPFRTRYKDRPYDGEVAYTDSELGRLISWLKTKKMYSNTAVVIVSDHGESLGEHGEREHGFFIYNSTVHVPLIVRLPKAQSSRRVAHPVEIASVAPTLLDVAGVRDEIEKQFDVKSLLASPGAATPVAYSETFYPFSSFGWSPLRGLQSGEFHYIQAPRSELYDLRVDAAERQNVAESKAAMGSALQQRLREIASKAVPKRDRSEARVGEDNAAQEKLQALGYVGYRAPVRNEALDKLADPKDKVEEFETILSAADAFRAGAFDKGRELLASVQKRDPQMYLVPFMLAQAALQQRDWSGATTNFRRALDLHPTFDQAMTGIARSLFEQGKSEEARVWLEKALKQNGTNFRAWYQLGWMQAQSAPDRAAQAFEKCLQIQPNFAPARRDLGMIAIRGQRYEQAAQELQKAADLGLKEAQLFNFLGIAYSRTNRLKRAVASYRKALELEPELAEAHLNLGFAYQRLNNIAQAKGAYSEACRLEPKLCSMIPQW